MKDRKEVCCPHCSRHCPLGAAKCKKGRAYFARFEKTEERKYKWEKYVVKGTSAWRLLFVGKRMKKALRSKKITGEQLNDLLTQEQQTVLDGLLDRLDEGIRRVETEGV